MRTKKPVEVNEKKQNYKNVLIRIGIGVIIGAVVSLVIDKYSMREVVCQIVAAEPEQGVVAARCLIK